MGTINKLLEPTEPSQLKREIGPVSLAANVVNLAIGAGIFVLPARVYESLGHASLLAYLACGVLIFMVMLCYAEVGARVSKTGGTYAYVESAFGPFAGFVTSNLYWFGFGLISDAAIINAIGDMLAIVWPAFKSFYPRALFFAGSFFIIAFINVRGVKYGSRLVEFITFAKLMPLGLLILIGWTTVDTTNLAFQEWPSLQQIGEACLFLFFAYGGGEASLTVSGEIKNPARTVPLGVLWGISFVVIVYIAIHLITQGILGEGIIANKDAPLAAASHEVFGPVGTGMILICSGICIWGAISGDVLTMPRFLYAASADKIYPSFLSKIHPRFATPYWAIAVYTILAFMFSLSNGFRSLAILSSAAILITYLAVVMSAIKFRIDEKTFKGNGFMVKGGYLVHFIALSTIIWFLSYLAINELIAIGLTILIFSGFYLIYRFKNNLKKPIVES